MHCVLVLGRVRLFCDPTDCSPPGSSVHGPRQEHWRGLPFPSPGDLPDPGIKPVSPAVAGGFFMTVSPGLKWGIDTKKPQVMSLSLLNYEKL